MLEQKLKDLWQRWLNEGQPFPSYERQQGAWTFIEFVSACEKTEAAAPDTAPATLCVSVNEQIKTKDKLA